MRQRITFIGVLVLIALSVVTPGWARVSADVSAVLDSSALHPGQTAMVGVVVTVQDGLHAQSHTPLDPTLKAFEVTIDANAAADFKAPIYPEGKIETYAGLGKISVYTGKVIVYVPMTVKADAPAGAITVSGHVDFQACNENTCFRPEAPTFSVASTIVPVSEAVTAANADVFAGAAAAVSAATGAAATQPAGNLPAISVGGGQTTIALFGESVDLSKHSVVLAALIAFMAGIVFNVVPCVLPVLPVKAVGFYEASQHSRGRSLLLGAVFSLGLIAVFAALGMIVLLSKTLFGSQITWGQQFSNPYFAWGLAIVLGCLAFGMMGAFSVNLPTSVYGLDFRHDTLSGNFLWGGLTAILSTPCTAPLFPPVLIFASTLPRIEGFSLVTLVGCGMASPYFILSAFPELARRFPRTGAISELVKQMMGFLLLGSAVFFAGQQLLGDPGQWWLVFGVAAWASLFLVVRTPQISKKVGALYLSTGLAIAITGGMLALTERLTVADEVRWQAYTPDAFNAARQTGKIVLIDFTANWCLNCKFVETTVYHDQRTLDAIKKLDVVMMKADLSDSGAIGWKLRNDLGNDGIPYTAIYMPGAAQPVGLASIYTTDTLLGVLNGGGSVAAVMDTVGK